MTTSIAKHYALIGLEDLNAKGMLANHGLAQAGSRASFFEVKRQLLYKSEQHGGYVQLVDQRYRQFQNVPSVQMGERRPAAL